MDIEDGGDGGFVPLFPISNADQLEYDFCFINGPDIQTPPRDPLAMDQYEPPGDVYLGLHAPSSSDHTHLFDIGSAVTTSSSGSSVYPYNNVPLVGIGGIVDIVGSPSQPTHDDSEVVDLEQPSTSQGPGRRKKQDSANTIKIRELENEIERIKQSTKTFEQQKIDYDTNFQRVLMTICQKFNEVIITKSVDAPTLADEKLVEKKYFDTVEELLKKYPEKDKPEELKNKVGVERWHMSILKQESMKIREEREMIEQDTQKMREEITEIESKLKQIYDFHHLLTTSAFLLDFAGGSAC